jgi:phosphotransacetylase
VRAPANYRHAGVVSIDPMLRGPARPVNNLRGGVRVGDMSRTLTLTAAKSRAR